MENLNKKNDGNYNSHFKGLGGIIFENDDFIALNKPSGLLSIPDREGKEISLKSLLQEKYARRLNDSVGQAVGRGLKYFNAPVHIVILLIFSFLLSIFLTL